MIKKSDNKKDNENKIDLVPICRECGVKLTDENWYPFNKKGHSYICKKCNYERVKEWRQNNRDKYNQTAKIWQQNNRDRQNQLTNESNHRLINDIIDGYGGKCACCDETRREYLSIDHKNGSGRKYTREMGSWGTQFYRWLRRNNYPEGFQVLCFNCNYGKRDYGICPHDKQAFKEVFESRGSSASAKLQWKLRLNVIEGYGGKCELCGESNPHFLTIDHIDGEGAKERKILGSWQVLYKKLRDENYPKDNYRLLCYNCNCALGFNRITEEELIRKMNK